MQNVKQTWPPLWWLMVWVSEGNTEMWYDQFMTSESCVQVQAKQKTNKQTKQNHQKAISGSLWLLIFCLAVMVGMFIVWTMDLSLIQGQKI